MSNFYEKYGKDIKIGDWMAGREIYTDFVSFDYFDYQSFLTGLVTKHSCKFFFNQISTLF